MIDYDLTDRTFTIDGQPATRAAALAMLHAEGLTTKEANLVLRAARRTAEIEHRTRPTDLLSISEAMRLFASVLELEWDRRQNVRRAERWIPANLRPARRPISIYSLKHTCDHAYQRAGSACYLRSDDFAKCLRRCDLKITRDGRGVYAKEIEYD